VMIHHGRSTPTLLCGYHNSWQLDMSNPNIKRSNA
jgi:hypothetical protein